MARKCQVKFEEANGRVAPFSCPNDAAGPFILACVHEHITKGWMCEECAKCGTKCHRCDRGKQPHRCWMNAADLPSTDQPRADGTTDYYGNWRPVSTASCPNRQEER